MAEVEYPLDRIRIVLVEPAGALNVGSIARVMKNMGLSRLVLVNPQCDRLGEDARLMAVHAADVLEAAQQVNSIPDALQGCQRAIATTVRDRSVETPLEYPHEALPWLHEHTRDGFPEAALIFGSEERGLSNTELNYAQRFVRIPTSEVYPSLNLAQAVAICCYELHQSTHRQASQLGEAQIVERSTWSAEHSAPLDALEGYFQQLEDLLLTIGYLYPHTASRRMEKLRRVFKRAELSEPEIAMLRGMLRQMNWALHTKPELSAED